MKPEDVSDIDDVQIVYEAAHSNSYSGFRHGKLGTPFDATDNFFAIHWGLVRATHLAGDGCHSQALNFFFWSLWCYYPECASDGAFCDDNKDIELRLLSGAAIMYSWGCPFPLEEMQKGNPFYALDLADSFPALDDAEWLLAFKDIVEGRDPLKRSPHRSRRSQRLRPVNPVALIAAAQTLISYATR